MSNADSLLSADLIRKISKALQKTGGATSEYLDAVVELNGLEHALQQLQALEPTEDNVGHVNAIRGMALACQIPLQEFMTKLDRYENSLGPWARRSSSGHFARKTRWAVSFSKEVEKLRAVVIGKQANIQLLLALHCSQTISSLCHRTKQEYSASKVRDEEHRAAIKQVQSAVGTAATETESGLQTMSNKINSSISSLKTVVDLIQDFVDTLPQGIRNRLQEIIQANERTYQILLQIQQHISSSPTSLQESNIIFTNALGEHRSLPYEFFCKWETFEGFLRAEFKNKPGESKILGGSFHIMNSNYSAIVNKEHWSRVVSEGTHLNMSMIMMHLSQYGRKCPQKDCAGVGVACSSGSDRMKCDTCYLSFQGMGELLGPRDITNDQIVLFNRIPEDFSPGNPARSCITDKDENQEEKLEASYISAIDQELQEIKVFRNVHVRFDAYIPFDMLVYHAKKQTVKLPALFHIHADFNVVASRVVDSLGLAKDPYSGPSMMYALDWQVTFSWQLDGGTGRGYTSTFVVCDDNHLGKYDVLVGSLKWYDEVHVERT
ncbi:MAG: hypothetical protein Q9178_004708 [Gyalolechia marmorata]